ncbi:MAG: 2-C-methyl-D-erythritol 4-phosphate cytidylyltransferase, partial [Bacteroidota bacterium]
MGSPHTKKPYLPLHDKPILTHTIGVFDQSPLVDAIYVIVDAADVALCRSL